MARAKQTRSVTVTRTRTKSKPSKPSGSSSGVSKRSNATKTNSQGPLRCFNCGKFMSHR